MRSVTILAALAVALVLVSAVDATGVNKRVQFSSGASGTVLKGVVDPARAERFTSGADTYVLAASAGQRMEVRLEATGKAVLYVYHLNGGKDYNSGALSSQTGNPLKAVVTLPSSGDYYVEVGSSGGAISYTLSVVIQ
ncbi:MAG: PPC domain-containing protein [Candidatus Eremiobacterota bacterium]